MTVSFKIPIRPSSFSSDEPPELIISLKEGDVSLFLSSMSDFIFNKEVESFKWESVTLRKQQDHIIISTAPISENVSLRIDKLEQSFYFGFLKDSLRVFFKECYRKGVSIPRGIFSDETIFGALADFIRSYTPGQTWVKAVLSQGVALMEDKYTRNKDGNTLLNIACYKSDEALEMFIQVIDIFTPEAFLRMGGMSLSQMEYFSKHPKFSSKCQLSDGFGIFDSVSKDTTIKISQQRRLLSDYEIMQGDEVIDNAIEEAIQKIDFLVKCGFDINIQNQHGRTILHNAYRIGSPALINHVIALGGDETIDDNEGLLPSECHRAAWYVNLIN